MATHPLMTPATLGGRTLHNRIVLPPLTRQRAAHGDVPTALMAQYYRQRAGAGFMVSEGTQIEPRGQGYAWTPGIYSPEQVAGWRETVASPFGLVSAIAPAEQMSLTPPYFALPPAGLDAYPAQW